MTRGAAHHAIGVCVLRRHLINAGAVVGGIRQHKHLASIAQFCNQAAGVACCKVQRNMQMHGRLFVITSTPRQGVPPRRSAPARPLRSSCTPASNRPGTAELGAGSVAATDTAQCPRCPKSPQNSCWSVLCMHGVRSLLLLSGRSRGRLQKKRRGHEVRLSTTAATCMCCSTNNLAARLCADSVYVIPPAQRAARPASARFASETSILPLVTVQ